MARSPRAPLLATVLAALLAVVALQVGGAALADADDRGQPPAEIDAAQNDSLPHGLPDGSTLVSVQGYDSFTDNDGRAYIVGPDGEEHWEWDPPNTRVFQSEMLENGNVLVAVARAVPDAECPEDVRDEPRDQCVQNRVVELDYETKEPVWEYAWWDSFVEYHEVHSATRTRDGETAIIDMGKNRVFTVDEDEEVTWEWNATEHLAQGSEFYGEYGGPEYEGPHQDWTHMNDVDELENGNVQLSIRNFDVVIEVDPETDEIVDVIGQPGNKDLINEQHNPQRLPERGTVLVADSENDRVVEVDVEAEEIVWSYGGSGELRWPRDANRLPNGHTLIVDSLNTRLVELDENGRVVWTHQVGHPTDDDRNRGLVYSAHRLSADGEFLRYEQSTFDDGESTAPTTTPGGSTSPDNDVLQFLYRLEAWGKLYLGGWVSLPVMAAGLVAVVVGLGVGGRRGLSAWRRRQE